VACDTCGKKERFYQCCEGRDVRRISADARLKGGARIVWADTSAGAITATLPALLCACQGGEIEIHADGAGTLEIKASAKDGASAIENVGESLILSGADGEWATLAPVVSGAPGAAIRKWRVMGYGVAPILNGAGPVLQTGAAGVYGFNAVNGTMIALALPIGLYAPTTVGAAVDVKGAPHLTSTGLAFVAGASGAGKYRATAGCVVVVALASTVSFAILDAATLLPLPGSVVTKTTLAPATEVDFSTQAIWPALAGSSLTVGWTTLAGGNSVTQQDVTALVSREGF